VYELQHSWTGLSVASSGRVTFSVSSLLQLEVLNTLEQNDPQCQRHCVQLKEWFTYRGHVCMVSSWA